MVLQEIIQTISCVDSGVVGGATLKLANHNLRQEKSTNKKYLTCYIGVQYIFSYKS